MESMAMSAHHIPGVEKTIKPSLSNGNVRVINEPKTVEALIYRSQV